MKFSKSEFKVPMINIALPILPSFAKFKLATLKIGNVHEVPKI
jgi:hypothetical protein